MIERLDTGLEVRAEGRKLSGIVLRYGDVSPSHRERFEPGSLRMAESVHLDLFHDPERAVAWQPGGGLTITQDMDEVFMSANVPPIPAGRRAIEAVKNGEARGLSVEFRAEAERREHGLRVIERAVLSGIGLVRNPSYHQSTVEARADDIWLTGAIPKEKSLTCECLPNEDCKKVYFKKAAFAKALRDAKDGKRNIVAQSGRLGPGPEGVSADVESGTLLLSETDDQMLLHLAGQSRATEAGRALQAAVPASVVHARPIINQADSEYQDIGGVRVFTHVALSSILLKAAAPESAWGWLGVILGMGEVPDEDDKEPEPRAERPRTWL